MLDDTGLLTGKLHDLIREGRTDESAVVELYQKGEGALFLSRALASFRHLSEEDARRLVLKWTAGVERPPQSPRHVRLMKPEISNQFGGVLESAKEQNGEPAGPDVSDKGIPETRVTS